MNIEKLSEKERGYLLGLFCGDGYAYHNKKDRHYSVDFYLNSKKDKDIHKRLIDLLRKIGLRVFVFKDTRFNCIRTRVHSKQFYHFCIKIYHSKSSNFDIGFMSGLIDSDGYVNFKKSTIQIINTNKKLLDKCREILYKFGIKANIKKRNISLKDKKHSYFLSIPVKFKRLKHFSIKAGRNLHSTAAG